MGDSTKRLMSGGALNGIRRCNSAMRGDITSASILVPLCCTRRASGFFGVPRSIWVVNGCPFTVPTMQMSFRREGLLIS